MEQAGSSGFRFAQKQQQKVKVRSNSQRDPDFDRGLTDNVGDNELFDARLERTNRNRQSSQSNNSTKALRTTKSGDLLTAESLSRRQAAENSQHPRISGNRPGYSNFSDLDNIVQEIQSAYRDISRLEQKCIEGYDNISALSTSEFNKEFWDVLYEDQCKLMDRYFDFMILAYHPAGGSTTTSLPKKYKIPLRIWNKGIFKFLDFLRTRMPASQELIFRYSLFCLGLLSMLVEPPYESRHMWLEALGDIARFSMALGSYPFADWRRIALYWYGRASVRSPAIGRIYHHCAVVCVNKLDSLFYFCKSLVSYNPFMPAREIALQLFNSNRENMESDNTASSLILDFHSKCFQNIKVGQLTSTIEKIITLILNCYFKLDAGLDYEIEDRGAILAACNICAILGYGDLKNIFMKKLRQEYLAKSEKVDVAAEEQNNNIPKPMESVFPTFDSLSFAFEIFRLYASLKPEDGAQHMVMWMHFLIAIMPHKQENDIFLNSGFPVHDLMKFLNSCVTKVDHFFDEEARAQQHDELMKAALENRLKIYRKPGHVLFHHRHSLAFFSQQISDQATRSFIPTLQSRPLPEELLTLGFVWSQGQVLPEPTLMRDYELGSYDEFMPGYIDPTYMTMIRLIRTVELGLQLTKVTHSWLGFDGTEFCIVDPVEIMSPLQADIETLNV